METRAAGVNPGLCLVSPSKVQDFIINKFVGRLQNDRAIHVVRIRRVRIHKTDFWHLSPGR
jgi:hypothetical protein